MSIATQYNIGDEFTVNGVSYMVVGIHVYVGIQGGVTERLYLGNGLWVTLEHGTSREMIRDFVSNINESCKNLGKEN